LGGVGRWSQGHPLSSHRRGWRGGPLLHGWRSSVAGGVRGRRRRGDTDAEHGLVLNLCRDGFGRRRGSIGTDEAGTAIPVGRSSGRTRQELVGPARIGIRSWRTEATCSKRSSHGTVRAEAGGGHLLLAELVRRREGRGRRIQGSVVRETRGSARVGCGGGRRRSDDSTLSSLTQVMWFLAASSRT
jgi:hypothetical protein